MNLVSLLISIWCAFDLVKAQLFPFSHLRHYIDQRHAETEILSTTSLPDDTNRFRYSKEVKYSGEPIVIHPFTDAAPTEKEDNSTEIAITFKSKYVPHRFVLEPNVDPNTQWIPNIGYNGPSESPSNHRTQKTSSPTSPTISTKTKFPKLLEKSSQQQVSETLVENIPALSVQIQFDSGIPTTNTSVGLIDYLVPPKFPSVYEDHTNEIYLPTAPPQTAIKVSINSTTSTTSKPKKKKLKRRKPLKSIARDSEKAIPNHNITSPEKRTRRRFRPSRVRTKTTEKPTADDGKTLSTDLSLAESGISFPRSFDKSHDRPSYASKQEASEPIGLMSSPGERVEFQLHGQNGPESYKFGFDTGNVKNRQFRYEEKDNQGNVKGHYGYYDKTGKLQIVKYRADENGFHASRA